MKLRALVGVLAAAWCVAAAGGRASAADPLSYDDPGMHFQAPAGWTRIDVPPGDPNSSDKRTVAAFAYHQGRSDQQTIVITVEGFDGTLDAFEKQHESDTRSASDSSFIEEHSQTQLSNGMPAYFFRARSGDQSSNRDVERAEYLVIDTQRGIDVALISGVGEVDPKAAKAALASLYVVVYPGRGHS
jgi:hypothetical protein